MGKVNNYPQNQHQQQQHEPTIHHLSHPHPLQLHNHHPQQALSLAPTTCSGCKLRASPGLIYTCTFCSYFLHISCSKLPHQITHPFDQNNHVLSLLHVPIYPEGLFRCDACGVQGNGFSYHCGACSIDLHTFCATKPLVLNHQSHQHQLSLTFSPPYENKTFSCDICQKLGSDHWLYRCNYCEFDVHLGCTTAKPPVLSPYPQAQAQIAPNMINKANPVVYNSTSTGGGPVAPSGPNGLMNGLVGQVIQGVVQQVLAPADDGGGAAADGGGIDIGAMGDLSYNN